MNIFKRKKKWSYEEIINRRIKTLEEARIMHFNRSQENMRDILKGDKEAYHKLEYNVSCMNQYTYEIQLLREILEEARA